MPANGLEIFQISVLHNLRAVLELLHRSFNQTWREVFLATSGARITKFFTSSVTAANPQPASLREGFLLLRCIQGQKIDP